MQAYKCDRCGRYYDNYDNHKVVLPGEAGKFQWRNIVLKNTCTTPEMCYDICADCLNDFVVWMLGEGEGIHG